MHSTLDMEFVSSRVKGVDTIFMGREVEVVKSQ